jgi:hypothetical protein
LGEDEEPICKEGQKMRYASTSINAITLIKKLRLFIALLGVLLCIIAMVIIVNNKEASPQSIWPLWIAGLVLIIIPFYVGAFKFKEATNDYIRFSAWGLWFVDIFLYYNEMENVNVKYTWYTSYFRFDMN